jgi:hypothetical protein
MSSKNEHTGDLIKTKPSDTYADNFDAIFRQTPTSSLLDDLKNLKAIDKDDPYWKKYFEDKDNAK